MKKFLIIAGLLALTGLVLRSNSLFDQKLSVSASINSVLSSFLGSSEKDLRERIDVLEKENKYLKGELGGNPPDLNNIKVYSSYPLNGRGEIIIAAGSKDGVSNGDAVVYRENILVGRVRSVFDKSSIVTTIFDPSWEIPVRIGTPEIDALMQGGNELKLTLIPSEDYVQEGDAVVSAGDIVPYGLEVGFVKTVNRVPGESFQSAVLEPGFKIKNLRDVSVYR